MPINSSSTTFIPSGQCNCQYPHDCNHDHFDPPADFIEPMPVFRGSTRMTTMNDINYLRNEIYNVLSHLENEQGFKVVLFDYQGDVNMTTHFDSLLSAIYETRDDLVNIGLSSESFNHYDGLPSGYSEEDDIYNPPPSAINTWCQGPYYHRRHRCNCNFN